MLTNSLISTFLICASTFLLAVCFKEEFDYFTSLLFDRIFKKYRSLKTRLNEIMQLSSEIRTKKLELEETKGKLEFLNVEIDYDPFKAKINDPANLNKTISEIVSELMHPSIELSNNMYSRQIDLVAGIAEVNNQSNILDHQLIELEREGTELKRKRSHLEGVLFKIIKAKQFMS